MSLRNYEAVTETLASLPGVEGASPVIYGKALVSSGTGSGLVTLKGVDPFREGSVTEFAGKMVAGSLERLGDPPHQSDGSPLAGLVVGEELALTLGVLVVVLGVPKWIARAHQGFGVLIFCAALTITHEVWTAMPAWPLEWPRSGTIKISGGRPGMSRTHSNPYQLSPVISGCRTH